MTRTLAAALALMALLVLTGVTWRLADGDASSWLLASVAALKIGIVGAVFLELTRSWPVWGGLLATGVVGILGLSAWLITA